MWRGTVVLVLAIGSCKCAQSATLFMVGPLGNDVIRLLSPDNSTQHAASAQSAIAASKYGDAVMLLAESYPENRTIVDWSTIALAVKRGVRFYIEYPDVLPAGIDERPGAGVDAGAMAGAGAGGISSRYSDHTTTGSASDVPWTHRLVINSGDVASHGLEKLRILQSHGSVAIDYCGDSCAKPTNATCAAICAGSLLTFAQVAGVDVAAFGIDSLSPALFKLEEGVLVSSTQLSNHVQGRFAPIEAWRSLWSYIVDSLLPGGAVDFPSWASPVRPRYGRTEPLPSSYRALAIASSADWLARGGKILVSYDEYNQTTCCKQVHGAVCSDVPCNASVVCPAPMAPASVLNATCIQEGWSSIIHRDGSQHLMPLFIRTDGNAESAMGLAMAGKLTFVYYRLDTPISSSYAHRSLHSL